VEDDLRANAARIPRRGADVTPKLAMRTQAPRELADAMTERPSLDMIARTLRLVEAMHDIGIPHERVLEVLGVSQCMLDDWSRQCGSLPMTNRPDGNPRRGSGIFR
jgi:hypothetical protein